MPQSLVVVVMIVMKRIVKSSRPFRQLSASPKTIGRRPRCVRKRIEREWYRFRGAKLREERSRRLIQVFPKMSL